MWSFTNSGSGYSKGELLEAEISAADQPSANFLSTVVKFNEYYGKAK